MDIDIFDNHSGHHQEIDLAQYEKIITKDPSLFVIICRNGKGRFRFHYKEIEIEKGELMIVPPDVPFITTSRDKDFMFDAIRVGRSHFDIVDDITVRPQFEHLMSGVPVLQLDENRMRMSHIILLYISKLIQEHEHSSAEQKTYLIQIINAYMKAMFLEVCHLAALKDSSFKSYVRQDITVKLFFKLLSANYKSREKLSFYSRLIGSSPKILTRKVFEHTGKNASYWIDEFTLIEAKRMLRTMDMTIQEISYDLSFATPSHFTKFFKKKTGLTPSEYKDYKKDI